MKCKYCSTKINYLKYVSICWYLKIDIIKLIKFLLKDKGMTVNGVKNVLKSNINSLDDYNSYSLKADYLKENLKVKSKTILEKIKKLKKNGKKISH